MSGSVVGISIENGAFHWMFTISSCINSVVILVTASGAPTAYKK